MLKTRKQLKAEAQGVLRANPMLRRQMLAFRLLGLAFSTVLGLSVGNPLTERFNEVLALIEAGNFTWNQIMLILQRTVTTNLGKITIVTVANLVWYLFATVVIFGMLMSIRRVVAQERPAQMSDLFDGFPLFGKAAGLSVLTTLLIFVRTLPAIVMIVVAQMAVGPNWMMSSLITCAGTIYAVRVSYRYEFATYILAEKPGLTVKQAIRESIDCTKGRIGALFSFDMSFIGWSFFVLGIEWLVAFVLGLAVPAIAPYIAALVVLPLCAWLYTYMNTSYTLFFRNVVGLDRPEASTAAPPPYTGGTGGSYSGPDIQI